MVLSIEERIKGFLFSPSETFDASKEDTLGDAFKYFVVILIIYTALTSVISVAYSMIGWKAGPWAPIVVAMSPLLSIASFIWGLILGISGVLIGGLWTHIWVYVVGSRKGVEQTIKALMYASTPMYLMGWIPFVILISGWLPIAIPGWFVLAIWTLIVGIIGIRQLQELSTGRAILALILAIIIPAIIIGAIFAAYIPTMPGPGLGPEHIVRP